MKNEILLINVLIETYMVEIYLDRREKIMVKKIMRDPLFLAQKSEDATEDDKQVVTDLLDTLKANLDHCVGINRVA